MGEAEVTGKKRPPEIERALRLFRFLKDFSERRVVAPLRVEQHPWQMRLQELPDYPSITVGSVSLPDATLQTGATPPGEAPSTSDEPLLRVSRPRLSECPSPPENIRPFLARGWKEPDREVETLLLNSETEDGGQQTEALRDDPDRAGEFSEWTLTRARWAQAERPARAAMKVFERLYELNAKVQRESERVELLIADGRLLWRNDDGVIDHPVILQQVSLTYDADRTEFQVHDTERTTELYPPALQLQGAIPGNRITELREELEKGGYHPLEGPGTSAYLRRIAQSLGPRGVFKESPDEAPATRDPVIIRDPLLILRVRPSGFPAAFDRIIQELEESDTLPVSLTRLVGVEQPRQPDEVVIENSPWGEPADVLLSKPANAEQIQIARALDRHRAVLVQGPPGTGKSHTIANLVGHLVAQGKRVLVTSHTTKALRVLREQIVETLRPLAVAVLDHDLESRQQLEESVRGILTRLTRSSEAELQREAVALESRRASISSEIEAVTRKLQSVREAEYLPISVAGESMSPSKAARWVVEHEPAHSWIPGPVDRGAPLPLSPTDLRRLYETNAEISSAEEAEIRATLPDPKRIPSPEALGEMLEALNGEESAEHASFWEEGPNESVLTALEDLEAIVGQTVSDLNALAPWQVGVVSIGHAGDGAIWSDLENEIESALRIAKRVEPLLMKRPVDLADLYGAFAARGNASGSEAEQVAAGCEQILEHLRQHGRIGWWQQIVKPQWKLICRHARVDGRRPVEEEDFEAIHASLELQDSRRRISARWKRQAEPVGLPQFEGFGESPEAACKEYSTQFQKLLSWWPERVTLVEAHAQPSGLRWAVLREYHVAHTDTGTPFERDVQLLIQGLPEVLSSRSRAAKRLRAERQLKELVEDLRTHRGALPAAMQTAILEKDLVAYGKAHQEVVRLARLNEVHRNRTAFLEKIEHAAPAWADLIRNRSDRHGTRALPGDPDLAWRWRQLTQEIEARGVLDERRLAEELNHLQKDLRRTTADLIDRKAWLAQLGRTDLHARQALQGWSDTVKRIGRGTGKRVPEMKAKARELLGNARHAVPVWIMPLQQVADSFDPTHGKFDVVIIDEASQADCQGLLAWYLGDRVVVVGDHEQVSPSAVGERVEGAETLIARHLDGIPNSHLYDGKTSVYDLGRRSFGGLISLREHFRCVPDIIEFSNALAYDFAIRPLRNPATARVPHVAEFFVGPELQPVRKGDTNLAEARVVAALAKAVSESEHYRTKSMGAISLLGDEQAFLIQSLALPLLGASEIERRRFLCGNAAQFQGDERDVMFLSMVEVPTGSILAIKQIDAFKQRYNVAASRAKDQVWLVHCLDPARDLQEGDLRRRLIEHVRNPGARRRALAKDQARAESPFEKEVLQRLIAAGYATRAQVQVGHYRIDIVVRGPEGEVAIECDGDRYHGLDELPADMARQAVLERAGWRFVRIRGTRFYRDPEGTMKWVFKELKRLGVERSSVDDLDADENLVGREERDRLIRRAWEIMKEQEWLPDDDMNAASV